MQKYQVNIS